MLLYGRLIFGFVEYAMVETRRDMVETRHVSTVKKSGMQDADSGTEDG